MKFLPQLHGEGRPGRSTSQRWQKMLESKRQRQLGAREACSLSLSLSLMGWWAVGWGQCLGKGSTW
jgi:hypothetical protein